MWIKTEFGSWINSRFIKFIKIIPTVEKIESAKDCLYPKYHIIVICENNYEEVISKNFDEKWEAENRLSEIISNLL